MKDINFDHLTPTEFENFCYDLLRELGFKTIDWRKGTGLPSSPSDKGRDIQAEYHVESVDGRVEIQKWFVECKHFKKGIPANKLESVLNWANAERPDKVLLIASNFLSNSAKDFIEKFKTNRKPPFEIIIWEKPKLVEFASIHFKLLCQYNLVNENDYFTSFLHPNHLKFVRGSSLHSMKYFFQILDNIDTVKRNEMMIHTFHNIIRPRYRNYSGDSSVSLNDLQIDKVDYFKFKEKCFEIANDISEDFIVSSIIHDTISYLLQIGDVTRIGEKINRNNELIETIKENIERNGPDVDIFRRILTQIVNTKKETPEMTRKYYEYYINFCENVVSQVLKEKVEIELPKELMLRAKRYNR